MVSRCLTYDNTEVNLLLIGYFYQDKFYFIDLGFKYNLFVKILNCFPCQFSFSGILNTLIYKHKLIWKLQISLRIGFTAFGLLLSAISTALAIVLLQIPEGYMFDLWLGHAALNTVSLCNILAFSVPPSFQSTSKKTNSAPTSAVLPPDSVK